MSKTTHTRVKYFRSREIDFSTGVHALESCFSSTCHYANEKRSPSWHRIKQFKKSNLGKTDSEIYAAETQPQNIYYWLPVFCNWKNSGDSILKRQRRLNNWEALWINHPLLYSISCSAMRGTHLVFGQGSQFRPHVLAPRLIEGEIPLRSRSARIRKRSWRSTLADKKRLQPLLPWPTILKPLRCHFDLHMRPCRDCAAAMANGWCKWTYRVT